MCLDSTCSLTELEDLEEYSQLEQTHNPSIFLYIWLLIMSSISENVLQSFNLMFVSDFMHFHGMPSWADFHALGTLKTR